MRLAVVNLTSAGMSGGYRNYLRHVLPLMAADGRVEELLCLSPASLGVEEWVPRGEKLRFAECASFRPFGISRDHALDERLAAFRPDVIFTPTARAVRFRDVPVVTMIQNMAPLVSRGACGFAEWPRLAVQRLETRRAIRSADGVVAISDFVRLFLVEKWGVPDEKIACVHFGAPPSAADSIRPVAVSREGGAFVFTAGSFEPYRGLEDVIACAEYSRKKLRRPLRVVLAGSARPSMRAYEGRLRALAEIAGVSADILWVGQLSTAEMFWCYENCVAFLMTSRVEACPNTALEAMACGAISVASDNPPLPELFGAAALYYAPRDGRALAERIADIGSWDASKRTSASMAARARSRFFSWDATVKKTLDFLGRARRPR